MEELTWDFRRFADRCLLCYRDITGIGWKLTEILQLHSIRRVYFDVWQFVRILTPMLIQDPALGEIPARQRYAFGLTKVAYKWLD